MVRPNSEPDLDLLLRDGKTREGETSSVKGKQGECHKNVARYWKKSGGDIVTGYALSKDGGWRQHSWIEDGGKILETTGDRREKYFGAPVEDPATWAERQSGKLRWWQPLGALLIVLLVALTAIWIASGAHIPGGGV